MWSTVYVEYFVLDSMLEKSKGELEIKFVETLEMTMIVLSLLGRTLLQRAPRHHNKPTFHTISQL